MKYVAIATLLLTILLGGTTGYYLIEGWRFSDALFMTVITLSTVGYGEVQPLSEAGKVYSIFLILSSVSVGTYAATRLVASIASIDFEERRKNKVQGKIDRLSDHAVVCGYGRMGEIICDELHKNSIKFVVIEQDPEVVHRLKESGYLYLAGDAANDDTLINAGVARARVLVSAIDNDSEGLYIALAGRSMKPDLFIIVRANEIKAKARILRAGADRVVLPHIMSGKTVADSVINPAVEDFFNLTGEAEDMAHRLQLMDMRVTTRSALCGHTIREVGASVNDIIIVGIKDGDGTFHFKPGADYRFKDGDCVIMMGTVEGHQRAKKVLKLS